MPERTWPRFRLCVDDGATNRDGELVGQSHLARSSRSPSRIPALGLRRVTSTRTILLRWQQAGASSSPVGSSYAQTHLLRSGDSNFVCVQSAYPHHSYSDYDDQRTIEFEGTLVAKVMRGAEFWHVDYRLALRRFRRFARRQRST